ncbi:MAG TPA: right-handed parallel beta-helix repeat-containing protein [Streptosporangiaceae bacterium]|nr:right-handed parallel beta-helix repeat-containing protein [Streptosporangiaceae bacterium]
MNVRRMAAIATTVIAALAVSENNCLAGAGVSAAARAVTEVPCGKPLSAVRPPAGGVVALKRGCTYDGSLAITADNVTVTARGSGPAPVVELRQDGAAINVSGSGVTIADVSLRGVAPRTWICDGRRTPAGHVDGIDLKAGATDNTITNVSASGFYAGVYVPPGAARNVIENSTFTNNKELDTNSPARSSGAFGVLIWGDDNTVRDNTITGSQACSLAYGFDGAAVEIFGGSNNLIAGNAASSDNTFTELGSPKGSAATSNTYLGNTVSDGAVSRGSTFLVTRGSADPDGPVHDTVVTGNTVNLTQPGDQGVVSYAWEPGDATLLTLTNNYLNLGSNQVLYTDGGFADGGGNTYLGSCDPAIACTPTTPPLIR